MATEQPKFSAAMFEGQAGPAPVLLLCEHASNAMPEAYGHLGLSEEIALSHVAWDPGALALARALSAYLGSPIVAGAVSRLLYDCNRPPEAPDAIPAVSEIYEIPGNFDLTSKEREQRVDLIYRPFCAAVESAIELVNPAALITVHSFTPVYFGKSRDVEIGILHDSDARLADALLDTLSDADAVVERNQPYGPEDGVTHSLALHGQSRGLLNVMIEVRNDLLADDAGVTRIGAMLGEALTTALAGAGVQAEGAAE